MVLALSRRRASEHTRADPLLFRSLSTGRGWARRPIDSPTQPARCRVDSDNAKLFPPARRSAEMQHPTTASGSASHRTHTHPLPRSAGPPASQISPGPLPFTAEDSL